ncbi:indolepyruvate ferredoxin oxidoreductase subunit alpha [Stieleria maiorica]|nr:4Fe-4S binding protein [Stieleria maiorica]
MGVPWRLAVARCVHRRLAVCPAECFHEDTTMVYIDPEECIDCGACVPECPTEAIFHEEEVPEEWHRFIELNASKARECPPAE